MDKTVNPFKDIQEPSLVMSRLSKSIYAQTAALLPVPYTESLRLKQSLFSDRVAPLKAMRESVVVQSRFIESTHLQISALSSALLPVQHIAESLGLKQSLIGKMVNPFKDIQEPSLSVSRLSKSIYAQTAALSTVPHTESLRLKLSPVPSTESLRLKQNLFSEMVDPFKATRESVVAQSKLIESTHAQIFAPSVGSRISESLRLNQRLMGDIVDPFKAMRESVVAQSKSIESIHAQIFAPSVCSRISESLRLNQRLMGDTVDRFRAMQVPIDTMAKLRESIYPQTTALSSALSPAPYTESLRLKQSLIGEIVDPLKAMREPVVAQCKSIESIYAQTATLSSASRIAKDLESMKVNWGSNREN